MTLDQLLSDFDAAVMRAQAANREELPAWAHRRAGLVAVVKALRDESYACDYGDEWLRAMGQDPGMTLEELLAPPSDAAPAEGRGGGIGMTLEELFAPGPTTPSSQEFPAIGGTGETAPATNPAPAVCEWIDQVKGMAWAGCDNKLYLIKSAVNGCNGCGKPIKFTEAK
jgi:hypothetical protein